MTLRDLLESVARGSMSVSEAESFLTSYGFVQLGHQRLDTHREGRTALPEVVFGASKSISQLREIVSYFSEHRESLLITRLDEPNAETLCEEFPGLSYDRLARLGSIQRSRNNVKGTVAVITAGASDIPVAEEAARSLEFFGAETRRAYDCGVAGLHRLFAAAPAIASADVLIVVAGMDGALPSVTAGLFSVPVIAVPTSVGYGASFEGLSALLTMMNSCAPGLSVVNIDNGFGAAMAAVSILRLAARRQDSADRPAAETVIEL